MVLESTIVCVDNSEFSRNGDFSPSRFAAQVDSVVTLCNSKVRSNPESTVGLLTMAGRSARILVTSTRDVDQVFSCMHDVKYDGYVADFVAGIQKAQLALKHRQNTMQRQRIVVFVSSPIGAPTEKLVQLGKKLKKNQVAVDVINIGKEGENTEKIDAFLQAVNSNDNSRALHVDSSGPSLPDSLMNSAIYADRDSGAGTGGGSGGESAANNFPFGVDPDQDPELAMVLRISMEEERARQEAAARSNPGQSSEQAGESASVAAKPAADAEYDDDDDLYGTSDQKDKMEVDASGSAGPSGTIEEDDELDEETRRAIELSKIDFESPPDNAGDKN